MINPLVRIVTLLVIAALTPTFTAIARDPGGDSAKAPLKVFILAGQSNMEGHAEIRTFDYIGKDPATAPLLKEMRNPDGTPRVCDKVWMSYLTGPYDGSANGEGLGKLTAGFGARGDQPSMDGGKIGPEFTFGITMEKELKEPILIIKTAWGGRSLNTEFRPASAGPYKLPKQIQEEWEKHPQGAHGIPKLEDRKKWQVDKDAASGVFYRMMVEHVKKVLADPARVCPSYDPKEGYELAGFVWLQGFNDLVDGQTYPNGQYDEYSRLLAHFIRDVRKDLSAPKMPFVIGVLGVEGEKNVNFRKAMAAPAAMPEFKGNVVAVDTAPFWDRDIESAEPKQGEYNEIVGTAHTLKADGKLNTERKWDKFWKPIGKPLPEERNWRFVMVDATEKKDKLEEFTDRRFRDIRLPAGMENWYMPDFDDSKWTAGKAPIGKGIWNHSGIALDKYSSLWGKEEFLLMRTAFEVDNLDYDSYRIAILARQGFHVYLNGHKIHTYIWWQDKPQYRSIVLDKEQTQYLKKGKNVLAVYANDQYSPDSPEHYTALDAWLEGITKADQEKLGLALKEVLSPKDREALKGASNGGYHYFGSAKIFAQMGKAFAEALLATVSAAETPIPKPDGKPADMGKPVQVFILLGQSNMIGMGRINAGDKGKPEGSLEHAVKSKRLYPYLVDEAGNWSERKDVRFVRMMQGNGLMNNEWMGVAQPEQIFKSTTIGVEFGIGHLVGNAIDAPVMILKSCIGNRALGWHLLPPGSARFEEGDKVYAGYRDAPDSWAKGTEPTPPVIQEGLVTLKGDQPAGWYAGKEYDDDTADAKKVLADLDKHYPGAKSYEVAGFFYWQGEKDAGNPVWAAHYEKNIVQFIKAVRKDFNAPNAKFVLGTMGESVKGSGGNGGKILEAHLAVDGIAGNYPEFKGNVATIYTHDMAQGGSGNGHYGGKAEVYMDVGEAMGRAMVELLKK